MAAHIALYGVNRRGLALIAADSRLLGEIEHIWGWNPTDREEIRRR